MTKQEYEASISLKWKSRSQMYSILPKRSVGVELGVQSGDNAEVLLDTVKPKALYLIDRWAGFVDKGGKPQKTKWTSLQNSRWHQVRHRFSSKKAAHIIRASSQDSYEAFGAYELDWIYIDANHKYAAVLFDIQVWAPRVKKGGVIMLHDFTMKISGGGPVEAALYALSDTRRFEPLGKTRYVEKTREMPSVAYRKLF